MAEKIEILYETGLWEKNSECELLFTAFDGKLLYGREKHEGNILKIRTAPRRFRRYSVNDADRCRMIYFSTDNGYHVWDMIWKEENDTCVIDPQEWLSFARNNLGKAGDHAMQADMMERLSGIQGLWIREYGYMIHRDVSGGDWGQDEIVACLCGKNIIMDEGSIFRLRINSHTNLRKQAEMIRPVLGGSKWNRENIRKLTDTLDTYDSNMFLDMKNDNGEYVHRQIRMDGGKVSERFL
ncbi:MAG: hypothetical protein K6G43_01995 [Lachnospiraceae bacterium]|nr:hypothetical protein [Lachnospiraceae bacterium]